DDVVAGRRDVAALDEDVEALALRRLDGDLGVRGAGLGRGAEELEGLGEDADGPAEVAGDRDAHDAVGDADELEEVSVVRVGQVVDDLAGDLAEDRLRVGDRVVNGDGRGLRGVRV